jgi:hypothetical protein
MQRSARDDFDLEAAKERGRGRSWLVLNSKVKVEMREKLERLASPVRLVSPVWLVSPVCPRRDMDLILRIPVWALAVASLKLDPETPVKIGLRMLRWQLTSMWDTRPTVLEMDRTWLKTDRGVDFQVEETFRWTWFRWHKDLDILLTVELAKWIWIKSRQDMASRLVELSPESTCGRAKWKLVNRALV